MQGDFYSAQRRQAWKILTRFQALNIAGAGPDPFSQFFLRQFSVFPQRGDVPAES
jgi:hypothetical protein